MSARWTDEPMSRSATDASMKSGIASDGTSSSTECSTIWSVPPRFTPGRLVLADHVHRHHDLDRLALGEAQEIDMDREVLDRVELVVARDGAGLLAVDVDLEDRGQEVAGEDQLLGLVEVEGDRRRRPRRLRR